jgi:hypothetical protein
MKYDYWNDDNTDMDLVDGVLSCRNTEVLHTVGYGYLHYDGCNIYRDDEGNAYYGVVVDSKRYVIPMTW